MPGAHGEGGEKGARNASGNAPVDSFHSMAIQYKNWVISGRSFLLGTLSYVLRVTSDILVYLNILPHQYFSTGYAAVIIQAVVFLAVKIAVRPSRFGVAWRAFLLGCLLNFGMVLMTYSSHQTFGIYCTALSFFHWSEYMMQTVFNPESTGTDSYMLYHSDAYVIAFLTSLLEFGAETYLWPGMKEPNILTNVGISMVVFGEVLRKSAMWTAQSNFNHYVQFDREEGHELVTHGVYSLFRHPSYVGWFWWSVGTQFILLNPLCMVAYTAASWKFFSDRIYTEEMTLIKFFGTQYLEYQQRVGTGIPFISGYTPRSISKPVPVESAVEKTEGLAAVRGSR